MQTDPEKSGIQIPLISKLLSFKRRKLKKSDVFNLLFYILIAFIIWVFIAATVNPDYQVRISEVPVVIDLSDSKAEAFGLSILEVEDVALEQAETIKVDCTVSGTRTSIGGLNRNDVVAYVDFDSTVTDTIGTQSLPIKLRSTNGAKFESYTLSQSTVSVTMDRYETLTFPVTEVRYPHLEHEDEVVVNTDAITVEPATVSISGPTTQLSNIDHIQITIDDEEELTQTKTYTNCTDYALIDAAGDEVSESAYQVQATGFSVRIPVYYTRTLPVTVELSNVPNNFDPETVLQRMRLNGSYYLPGYGDEDSENLMITLETSDPENKAKLDAMESWTIGTIPLYSVSLGNPIEIAVDMAEGYVDRSYLDKVYVTVDATDLVAETRIIKNSDIQLLNPVPNYSFTKQSPTGNSFVTLIGTKEELAKIDSSELQASINLINVSVSQEGTISQAFTVTLPDTVSGVWVSPQPKVYIIVSVDG